MSASLEELATRLRAVIAGIDEAVIRALHAQAGTREACASYVEATTGSRHPTIRRAIGDTRAASDLAGATARMLAGSAEALAAYLAAIGCAASPSGEALPPGEAILSGAEDFEARAAAFHRKASEAIVDQEDGIARHEEASRAVVASMKRQPGGEGSRPVVGPPRDVPKFEPASTDSQPGHGRDRRRR